MPAPSLGRLVLALVLLGTLFALVERWRPARPSRGFRRDGLLLDVAYWFFTPLVTRTVARVTVIVAVVLMAVAAGVPLERDKLAAFATGGGLAERQPLGLQVAEILILGDLVGYGMHRLFHRGRLWPFHAVHHSSTELDWLSSVRLHPVNDVVTRLVQAVPFVLLGFTPGVVALYLPFLTLHALFLHANVSWDFGPLRSVISSPRFHRWHHTAEAEGLDRNFAGLFPWIDRVFGTYYMPEGRQPERFGVEGLSVPPGLLAQLAFPFRRRAA